MEAAELPPLVAETHSAWVVMLGDRAYKLKKPVKLDFLDFSTLEARKAVAHREVELNRRLAPDVYLGVADLVGPDGEVCEHIVVMRRMPADRRLSTLVVEHVALDDEIREIACTVAAFHSRAATSPEIAAAGSPDAVRAKAESDLEQMEVFAGGLLDADVLTEVAQRVERYLDGRKRLFEARVASGCVRDGHGDMLAGDVFCLPDGPRILDCIEFDDQLRYGDVLADIGFLAMDLERLGAPALAARLLASYHEFSGEQHPASLADYYVAARAIIRSKVACIRARQGDDTAREEAGALLVLALEHLRRGQIRLVLVGGTPGTGKSTLAVALADRLGWSVIRSDEVRKDITGIGHGAGPASGFREGAYDDATTSATYDALLDRARLALELGESVILDASWSDSRRRDEAARIADQTSSELVGLWCDVSGEVAASRMLERRSRGGDPSDATPDIAAAMRASFEDWPSATRIGTEGRLATSLAAAIAAIDEAT